MSLTIHRAISTAIIAATVSLGSVSVAMAQTTAAPDTTAAPTKSEARAAHRQAGKAHRAAKNAELSKLEKNGYTPAKNDLNYPDKLQAAEKKSGQ